MFGLNSIFIQTIFLPLLRLIIIIQNLRKGGMAIKQLKKKKKKDLKHNIFCLLLDQLTGIG